MTKEEYESELFKLREERRLLHDKSDVGHYILKLKYLRIWINAKIYRRVLDQQENEYFKIMTYGPEMWSFEDYFKTITGEIKLYA